MKAGNARHCYGKGLKINPDIVLNNIHMKAKILLLLGLAVTTFSSCVREEVYVYNEIPDADVVYDFWSGPAGTLIEGEVFNDGTTYLYAVELEVYMFDRYGDLIEKDWYWVNTYSYPGESSFFTLDLGVPHVSNVDIRPVSFDY